MANMVKAKIMHDHAGPIALPQFCRHMPRHIIIHFSEILAINSQFATSTIHCPDEEALTETKKLEVPSVREKVSGNNFSQVSSPNIVNFPPGMLFNCESHVS